MKLLKALTILAMNMTLNQLALADAPMTDIFNIQSNPQQIKADVLVNCVMGTGSQKKELEINYVNLKYIDCKKEIVRIFNQLKKEVSDSCDKDIRVQAKLMVVNSYKMIDERGDTLIKCEKSNTPPVVQEPTLEQRLAQALKENSVLKQKNAELEKVVVAKNSELEKQGKLVESMKKAIAGLQKEMQSMVKMARQTIDSLQKNLKQLLSEREQMKKQIAELMKKQNERLPAAVEVKK